MKIHKYTQEEREFLKEFVPGHSYKEIQKAFIEKFNWDISLGQIKNSIQRYNLNTGRTGHYEKGHISYNKGEKGFCVPGSEKGWFKKGHIPKNYKAVGSERINRDGYIEIKVEDPNKWKLKHRVVWEEINGKVPQGHVLIFKDGDKRNTDIDNLLLVSREVLMIMNKSGLSKNEYKETSALIAELQIKTNQKRRKND